jgi:LemA protein
MKKNPLFFGLLLVAATALLMALWLVSDYNGMARSDEQADRQWGQIQAQLQRRLDLVPSLVESVQAYMTHEKETLVAVVEARSRAVTSLQAAGTGREPAAVRQMDQDQAGLSASLHTLMVLAERYPDLKANQNIASLQDQLEGTENRIATERMRYNESVEAYNQQLRVFPSNVIASVMHFTPREYFESKMEAAEMPKLGFKK